jgi:primary-amine oxidase
VLRAGEFPTQSIVEKGKAPADGLVQWTAADRNVEGEDIVLWHSFGVTHVPRVEDFPVMPVEVTGFMLKPDGFFAGNPAVDLLPEGSGASKQCCIPAL